MSVHKIAFTGDQVFSATHTSGNGIYFRSTDASDYNDLVLYGRQTSGTTAARSVLSIASGAGKVERLSSNAWNELYLTDYNGTLAGIGSVFSNDGTAATGSVKVTSQPSDGETFIIGLTGFLTTFTFKTSVSSGGHVKIGSSTAETADNLASAINDAQTGSSNPSVPASPIITVPLESRGFNIRSEPDIFISAFLSLELLKNSKGCPLYILCFILKT